MTTVSIDVFLPLYGVSSSFSNFVVNGRSKLALRNSILELLPMYKPRAQALWFQILFIKFKQIVRRRGLGDGSFQEHLMDFSSSTAVSKVELKSTAIDIGVTMTVKAVAEFLSHDPIVAYNMLVGKISSATTDGSLQNLIRAQASLIGDSSLITVSTPVAPSFSAYSAQIIKTIAPSRWPSSSPSSKPTQRPQKPSEPDNRFNIAIGAALGSMLVVVAAIVLYYSSKGAAGKFIEQYKCCFKRVVPEPDAWMLRQEKSGGGAESATPYTVTCGEWSCIYYKPRIAPAPPPLLPTFLGDDERKSCEEYEPIATFRPTYDLALSTSQRVVPLELGIHPGPARSKSLARSAASVAIQAKFARGLQRKEKLRLHRKVVEIVASASPILSSKAAAIVFAEPHSEKIEF